MRHRRLLVVVALVAGVLGSAAQATPAGAACAAATRTIGGSFVGEDGRQLSGIVGIVLFDSAGRSIGMDGCPQPVGGYVAHQFINLHPSGSHFLLGTNGASSGYSAAWQIGGLPSNAASAWVEAYPKSNTPDTTGYYHDQTDYRRYGGAMRRAVGISTNVDVRMPLNCGLGAGGNNGTIEALVFRNGAPAPVVSAWAFSRGAEGTGQILGFVTSNEAGSGRFAIRALESDQSYAIQFNLADGSHYWFEHDYGSGVPVLPCTTTNRTFVLNPDGRAYVTGGGFSSPPGPGAVDHGGARSYFYRGADGAMWQQNDAAGSAAFSLGGQITGDPDATSWGSGRVDVVARGSDGQVWWRAYSGGSGWAPWVALGGGTQQSPAIVSWGPGRLDVVVTGNDGQLWHKQSGNGGATWSGWSALGGRLSSAPDVAAWGANRLDIFARGVDGAAWHRAWTGGAWGPWEFLGGGLGGGPGAAAPAPNRLDIVVRGADNRAWIMSWTGTAWAGWNGLNGGATVADPDLATFGGRTTAYVRGTDGRFWRSERPSPGANYGTWAQAAGS